MKFQPGDKVRKTSGSQWKGTVVGTYSTELTPEGYAVESSAETGSVQIYPAKALEARVEPTPAQDEWEAPIFGNEDHVSIPRGLIGAACSAIDKKRDAPKVLAELRRYTFGDLSRPAQTEQQPEQSGNELALLRMGLAQACAERDQLRAEVGALRKAFGECIQSLHDEMLQSYGGQKPNDMHPVTRRNYDRDMAEIAEYRAALAAKEA